MTTAEVILQRVRYATTPERVAELDEGRWGFCERCALGVMVVVRPRR